MRTRYWLALLIFPIMLWGLPNLKAQDQAPDQVQEQGQTQEQQQENKSTGVARISYINGQVSTMRGDTDQWAAATLNAPLANGDKISTSNGSRTEVELDYANVLRLAGQTEASIANLSHDKIQVQVAQGLVDYWVDKDNQADLEIDTPNVAVHPLEPGVYRIEVDSASETKVIVRKGRAQISTPQGSAELKQDEMMEVQGVENPQYQVVGAPGQDEWDRWNSQRNNTIADARSWQYDNRYYTGTENLDTYGQWQYVPGYDWCWTPYINEGWVPYSNGSWVWEPFYGWTWVSYEPWGWAPYHYGRWFLYGNSWMWWPGPVTPFYRPIWAPAYVSFFGFGAGGFGFGFGLGFGFGFGRIGWLPIGPRDPFFPWYGAGRFGYHVMNVANLRGFGRLGYGNMPYFRPLAGAGRPDYSNFREAMTNARVRGALVNMPGNRFGAGPVGRSSERFGVSQAQFRQASFVSGHVPMVPTRASLNASGRMASRGSMPSAAVNSRHFFAVQRPAAASRSFTQEAANVRQMVQNNRGTSVAGGARGFGAGGSRSYGGASSGRSSFGGSGTPSSRTSSAQTGWRRFASTNSSRASQSSGSQGNRASERQFSPSSQRSTSGWQRFAGSGNSNRARSQFRSGSSASGNSGWRGSSRGFGSSSGGRQGWSRFTPQARQGFDRSSAGFSRGYSGQGFGGYEKPALNLRRSIVSGGGSGGSRGSWGTGYYRSSPNRSSSTGSSSGGGSHNSGGGFHGGGGGFHGGGGGGGGGGGHGGGHGR
jgi:FecR protein